MLPSFRVASRAFAPCAALLLVLAGCGSRQRASEAPPATTPAPVADSVAAPAPDSLAAAPDTAAPAAPASFARWPVESPKHLTALVDSLGPERWRQVLKLNRVDLKHVRDRDSLVVGGALDDSLALAPFPREWGAIRDSGKVLFVSRRVQAFAAYDSGRLVQWGPTSTGRRAKPTPAGLYHATWKDKSRISTVDDAWLLHWCVNIENREGVSLHEYELPGRPASHSCVRLLESDARWVYAWCDQWVLAADRRFVAKPGTPVVVFGEYAWGQRAPWKLLPESPAAATLAPDELDDALRTWRQAVVPDFTPVADKAPPAKATPRRRAIAPPAASDTLRTSTGPGRRAVAPPDASDTLRTSTGPRRRAVAPPAGYDTLRAPAGGQRPH